MCKKDGIYARRASAQGGQAHGDAATSVDDEDLIAYEHCVRRAGAVRVGRGEPSSQKHALHGRCGRLGRCLNGAENEKRTNQCMVESHRRALLKATHYSRACETNAVIGDEITF